VSLSGTYNVFSGAGQSPSIGVVHVSASSSCHIQTILPRNREISYNCKGDKRNRERVG